MKNSKILALMFLLLTVMVTPAFAIDSTALFNTQVLGTSIEKGASDGTPIGTVVTWPAMANPSDPGNWLECNGQTISQASYPELYAIIGSKVPDYTGMFLRGMGGNSAALGLKQGEGVNIAGGAVIQLQGTLTIAGPNSYYDESKHNNGIRGAEVYSTGRSYDSMASGFSGRYTAPSGGYVSIPMNIKTNSPETRPANVAVRYLIRAKN